jgi:U3 small nucleolar RNA-associated protein 10
LLARVQDTCQSVIEVLYSEPSTTLPILVKHAPTYITNLSFVLSATGAKPKRALLRVHLNFLGTHFFQTGSPHLDDIFHRILFPLLLFSKPRQHTAEVVWDIISSSLQRVDIKKAAAYEWLAGCASIIDSEKQKDGVDTVERMASLNLAIAAQFASRWFTIHRHTRCLMTRISSENILMSNNYTAHFDALVSKLHDTDPHSRVLSYLVARALLRQLSGEHQLEAAYKLLNVIGTKHLAGIEDLPPGKDDLFDVRCMISKKRYLGMWNDVDSMQVVDDKTLGKIIVVKPSSKNTSHWLQISLLALVPSMPRPQGLTINWMTDNTSVCCWCPPDE